MIYFAKRNLLLFFRDKAAVFFSLLASLIIIGLYVLFLGDTFASSMKEIPNARELMDNWIMAGLLAVTSFTTTLGAFGIMIDDKVKKISKDFYSSPISKNSLTAGYIFSSFLIGIIISLITFIMAEIYIVSYGGAFLSIIDALKVFAVIIITTFMNTSIILFIVSFINSLNAFSTVSTIIGTIIGFITGIYIPMGNLPNAVQWVIKLFPVSHCASILRKIMMEQPIKNSFVNAPESEIAKFKEIFGVSFKISDSEITTVISLLFLIVTTIVFYILAVLRVKKSNKK